MKIQADVWLSSEDTDEYWAEGVKGSVEVETTDVDEVRIGVKLGGESSDAATLYVSRDSADKLARFLAAASVADVEAVVGGYRVAVRGEEAATEQAMSEIRPSVEWQRENLVRTDDGKLGYCPDCKLVRPLLYPSCDHGMGTFLGGFMPPEERTPLAFVEPQEGAVLLVPIEDSPDQYHAYWEPVALPSGEKKPQ